MLKRYVLFRHGNEHGHDTGNYWIGELGSNFYGISDNTIKKAIIKRKSSNEKSVNK
jgi:hypothetical protein